MEIAKNAEQRKLDKRKILQRLRKRWNAKIQKSARKARKEEHKKLKKRTTMNRKEGRKEPTSAKNWEAYPRTYLSSPSNPCLAYLCCYPSSSNTSFQTSATRQRKSDVACTGAQILQEALGQVADGKLQEAERRLSQSPPSSKSVTEGDFGLHHCLSRKPRPLIVKLAESRCL
jgi:hypothetical protein